MFFCYYFLFIKTFFFPFGSIVTLSVSSYFLYVTPHSSNIRRDAIFDEVTDFSGAEAWLNAKFDEYIKKHNYILFFFDVSEYLTDLKYREDCNARIDMIHRNSSTSQKVLVVGTHIDLVTANYRADLENLFAGKTYQRLLSRIVYIDTRKKECVKTILNELKK